MKVSSLDELERVLLLVNKHAIDVLELDGVKVVRSAFPRVDAPASVPTDSKADDAELEELASWLEGGAAN